MEYTLIRVVDAGRKAGGITPPESFSVFVVGYVPFWNADNTDCNSVSWQWWGYSDAKLNTGLRQQMNDLTLQLNAVIQATTVKLTELGVFYVDGFQNEYNSHRFCESQASLNGASNRPISKDTWFWTDDS